jgi:hypothetical protein
VKRPEVFEVVAAEERDSLELSYPDRRLLGFDARQLLRVTDASAVSQAARPRIDVRVGWQRG